MNLDATLQRCLQQIEAGESIDACLARYPDQAGALAPMLAAAVQVRAHAGARLSETQRLQAKTALRQTLATHPPAAQKTPRSRWTLHLGGARRLAAIAAVAVLLLVVVSVGAVASSEPGNPAYAVRVIAERAPALVGPDATARTAAELTVADRRLADLQSHLERAGRLEPAALRALLAGDEAAARQAVRAGRMERLRVARRLATHARLLQALADRVEDPRSAQLLNEASRRTLALAVRLRAAPPGQSPGVQLPNDDMPSASRQPVAAPINTASPTAAATATATATPTATATAAATATASSTPAPAAAPLPTATRAPTEGLGASPPVEPTQTEATAPPRPRQTALAQTATARAERATARAETATARASRTPGPGPRQTAIAQTATARASRTPGPGPRQTALAQTATAMAQTATPNPNPPTATPNEPDGQPTPTDSAVPSPPPRADGWRPR